MNISFTTRRKDDKLIKYLIKSQKELLKECHDDFNSTKIQDAIARLRAKNKVQNEL